MMVGNSSEQTFVVRLRPTALVLLTSAAFVVTLRLAVAAVVPNWAASLLVTISFFGVLAAIASISGQRAAFHRRPGFWISALAACLYLPCLGTFGLVDPWETHYAEVAREMLERRDFVSPWWANEGWFMTKPILIFWLEAASMALLGVHTGPNEVLVGAAGALARPEWAVRLPSFLCAVAGVYALYRGVSRAAGERAGVLSAVVLLTMPGFAILAHQAITDMPLVAGVAGAVGILVGASAISDSRESRGLMIRVMGRDLVLHGGHLAAALYGALVVPQLLVLLGAHVHVDSGALVWGRDRLVAGSPHACTLPGQQTCREIAHAHPWLSPLAQAALWLPVMAYTTLRIADTRRAKNQWVIIAWLFAALATMSKGPAGLVIPMAAAAMLLAIRQSLRPLSWMELATGALVTISLVGPWYVAAYARHGRSFLDELVLRNMLGRTLDHLHDTNGGDDVGITYFVKQLGYATLPWFGFALAALFSLSTAARFGRKATAKAMMAGAFLVAFTLVSMMKTKFHHYVLVALPPCAALVGLWLDELWEEARTATTRHEAARTLVVLVLVAATTVLVGFDVVSVPNHFAKLMTYRYSRAWPSEAWMATVMGCLVGALSLAMVGAAVHRLRRKALIGCAVLAAAFAVFVLDVYWLRTGPLGGQRAVFDAYYRARANDSNRADLVAYQLNWKGENFYSGNDLAIFIQSGAPFRKYVDERKRHDAHVLYAVTETGRLSSLRSELGALRSFDVLTDATASPEFSLVRAVLAP